MLRSYMLVLLLSLAVLTSGCEKRADVAVRIGPIEITVSEFEEEFKASRYSYAEDGRRKFLDQYIAKKLILFEAEKMGLAHDPEFLEDIQKYWEQALLKRMLTEKAKLVAVKTPVSDQEIRAYFDRHKDEFPLNNVQEVYEQVKWRLFKEKQQEAMVAWTEELRRSSDVEIDYKLLKIAK